MKKLNNKGFTLIELLAVIAILSILIVVAFPGVISLYNDAKKNTFKAQAQSVWRSVEQQAIKNSFENNPPTCYSGGPTWTTYPSGSFEMTGNVRYRAAVDGNGKISTLTVQQMNGAIIVYSTTMTDVNTVTVSTTGSAIVTCP